MKKRLVILGAGESGVGAAILGLQQGFDVFVSDRGEIKDKYKKELVEIGVDFEEKKHTEEQILNASLVVKSPGIPDNVPLIQRLKEKGISVISEIEFGGRYTNAVKVCITGSNGKTTTTMLLYHILQKAGLKVGLAGNVGTSFARQVAAGDRDVYVIELSSFQLDGVYDFKAEVAILMNITPDHLDRYDYKMENYINSKFRIINNQTQDDHFIYCADDPVLKEEIKKRHIPSVHLPFSMEDIVEQGAFVDEEQKLTIKFKDDIMSMFLRELALQGRHNTYNSMAAGIAARVLKIRKSVIRESLTDFQGVEHRLEHLHKVRGMEFINDSKATNVNSTWYALECMTQPTIWIAGGVDKGNDYSELFDLAEKKVKALICLGVDNEKLKNSFEGKITTIIEAKSMHEAVKSAYFIGEKGDAVLLSPCCASFDLFDNYEDRGRQFKECVRNL